MVSGVLNSLFNHLPHFEFLDESNLLLNVTFAGMMGGSTGILLFVVISELYRYINE